MNQTSSLLDRFDERAQTVIHMFGQTGALSVMWLVSWKWIAPLIGVERLDPVEFIQSLMYIAAAISLSEVETSQTLMGTILGFGLWIFPFFVALCGVATIGAVIWYITSRFTNSSVATSIEGEK